MNLQEMVNYSAYYYFISTIHNYFLYNKNKELLILFVNSTLYDIYKQYYDYDYDYYLNDTFDKNECTIKFFEYYI